MTAGDALNGLSDWSWPPNAQSSRSHFSAFGATQKYTWVCDDGRTR